MGVKGFQFDAALAAEFVACDLWGRGDPSPSRVAVKAMVSPDFTFYAAEENHHRHFLARSGGRTVGRLTAVVNAKLQRSVGQRVGTLGLYECVPDGHVACDLLDAGIGWLRGQGVDRIWGPMNFDIWHGYRFLIEGFDHDSFLGEPRNPSYYPEQFEHHGFRAIRWWSSAEFEGAAALRHLVEDWRSVHDGFAERGFTFRTADADHLEDGLRETVTILVDSFARFPGFTPIDARDFLALLAPARPALRAELLSFLDDRAGRPLACTISVADAADRAVLYMGGKIRGAESIRGIGAAMFYQAVEAIERQRYRRMIVALMEEGNPFDRICRARGPVGSRRYALFEWTP